MDDLTAWLLTDGERGNPATRLDDGHPGDTAWSTGNLVRPLVHGATYFAELYQRIEATRAGDLIYFTDWQGDPDERLTGEPGSEVADVLGRADERGVDVRGLVWRSHLHAFGFTAEENRELGRKLQRRGAEVLLDMRVRVGGSHHQKMVVIRHRDDPSRDVAYVGGIDLGHARRDDLAHHGDPQPFPMAREYGPTPPWHDIQTAIAGPAVHDVETVFRERWEDPGPLTRNPFSVLRDRLRHFDVETSPLPPQSPPPPPVEGGTHTVQLLRTYPQLRGRPDYPFAPGGERSVARGYSKALGRAQDLVYVEDQYLWGRHIGQIFTRALLEHPELRVIAVVPLHPNVNGHLARTPELVGRRRSMAQMAEAAPGRVAFYGIENHAGTPVYVHAKICIVDDTWATVGSDNFNRRSWTHDSELAAAVVDADGPAGYARRLRLTLAAEHLDRDAVDEHGELADPTEVSDCVDAQGMFEAFARTAAALDRWHESGRMGPRPPGRLRCLGPPELGGFTRVAALAPYRALHDQDGRPMKLRLRDRY